MLCYFGHFISWQYINKQVSPYLSFCPEGHPATHNKYELQQNNVFLKIKILQKVPHFFQASWAVSSLLASLEQKRNIFCENEALNITQLPRIYCK